MNLLLIEPAELRHDNTARLTDDRARHLRDVLHATPGDAFRIGIVDGGLGTGRVLDLDDGAATLLCTVDEPPLPVPGIDLLLALPRPKVLRRLYAQLAALGVGRIILTNAARVERHYFDTHVLSPGCFRPLLIEGLQQARDTRVPAVSVHRQFRVLVEDLLDDLSPSSVRLVGHPGAAPSVIDAVAPAPDRRLLLAIGPEGGWNAFELALLQHHGFQAVAMGPRTLRTDTACIALVTLAHAALERGTRLG